MYPNTSPYPPQQPLPFPNQPTHGIDPRDWSYPPQQPLPFPNQPTHGINPRDRSYPPQQPLPFPNQPTHVIAPRDWSSGLCDCFHDPSTCFITCCCPCVTFGQVAEIVDRGGTSCAVAGIIFAVLIHFGCPCLFSCTYRTKLRALYTLKEDPCNDFLVHCCCGPCAICQEYRELKNFGADPAIGWTANVESWNRGAKTEPPPVYPGMNR